MLKKDNTLEAFFVLILFIFHTSLFWHYTVDDAFIYFRYSDNWAKGYGLVYNLGDRVEGYTGILWLILLGLFSKLEINLILISKILGIIFGSLTLIITLKINELLKHQKINSTYIIIGTFLASDISIAIYSVAGLETLLFTFLLTLAIYVYLKEEYNNSFPLSGFIFGLSYLARPEGILYFFCIILFNIVYKFINKENIQWNRLFLLLSMFLIIVIPHFIWRYSYYNELLPNTYYAKTGRGLRQSLSGIRYIISFINYTGILPLAFAIFLSTMKKSKELILLLFLIFVHCLYIIKISGGDWMPRFRYIVPILPIFYLLAGAGLMEIYNAIKNQINAKQSLIFIKVISIGFVLLIVSLRLLSSILSTTSFSDLPHGEQAELKMNLTNAFIETGKKLKEISHPQFTLGANDVGALPYYSGLYTIDMRGLVDKHIARTKPKGKEKTRYDVDYVMSQKPTFIELCGSAEFSPVPGDIEMWKHKDFLDNYISLSTIVPNIPIVIWVRKDAIASLKLNNKYIK